MNDLMNTVCRERPVGTLNNTEINTYLEKQLVAWGYDVSSIPFDCVVWSSGSSQLHTQGESLEIQPSPFSEGFTGKGELTFADSLVCLDRLDCNGKILLLSGELTQTPLQPKNYPFYYPDEHKQLIELLEQKAPKAIIALTGSDELSGLSPFPLFDDGNFLQHLEAAGKRVSPLINIVSPCHMGADNAVSFYNFDAQSRETALGLFHEHTHNVEGRPIAALVCAEVAARKAAS